MKKVMLLVGVMMFAPFVNATGFDPDDPSTWCIETFWNFGTLKNDETMPKYVVYQSVCDYPEYNTSVLVDMKTGKSYPGIPPELPFP